MFLRKEQRPVINEAILRWGGEKMKEMQEKAEEKKEHVLAWLDDERLANIILAKSQSNFYAKKKTHVLYLYPRLLIFRRENKRKTAMVD